MAFSLNVHDKIIMKETNTRERGELKNERGEAWR